MQSHNNPSHVGNSQGQQSKGYTYSTPNVVPCSDYAASVSKSKNVNTSTAPLTSWRGLKTLFSPLGFDDYEPFNPAELEEANKKYCIVETGGKNGTEK